MESCNVARSPSAADEVFGTAVVSNSAGALIYKWDGGYLDGDPVTLTLAGGTTSRLDTDPTYGRRLTISPNGNTLSMMIEARLRGVLSQYTQFGFLAKMRLPRYTSGNFFFRAVEDGTGVATWQILDAERHSGQEVTIVLPYRSKNAITRAIGIQFAPDGASPASGVSGDLELYYFAAYAGETVPRREYPSYPRNISTWAASIPTAGSFVAGDIVYNNAPTLDPDNMSLLGWRRLTSGSGHVPGTDWALMYVSHVPQGG